jgi:hypothetical protein
VIPEIEIWRVANEELAADGDLAGVAVWLRIIDATGQLAITTPSGPAH